MRKETQRAAKSRKEPQQEKPTRPRGRPVKHPMPEPIPDTPENIARAVLATPNKRDDEWEYLKKEDD